MAGGKNRKAIKGLARGLAKKLATSLSEEQAKPQAKSTAAKPPKDGTKPQARKNASPKRKEPSKAQKTPRQRPRKQTAPKQKKEKKYILLSKNGVTLGFGFDVRKHGAVLPKDSRVPNGYHQIFDGTLKEFQEFLEANGHSETTSKIVYSLAKNPGQKADGTPLVEKKKKSDAAFVSTPPPAFKDEKWRKEARALEEEGQPNQREPHRPTRKAVEDPSQEAVEKEVEQKSPIWAEKLEFQTLQKAKVALPMAVLGVCLLFPGAFEFASTGNQMSRLMIAGGGSLFILSILIMTFGIDKMLNASSSAAENIKVLYTKK